MFRFVTMCGLIGMVSCGVISDSSDSGNGAESHQGVVTGISAETLLKEVEQLASDEFEGRSPGSTGEVLTVAYLTEQFRALGLEPGNPDGTWVQNVPLVGITPVSGDTLSISAGSVTRTFEPGTHYVALSLIHI